jgi:hypothetical protein
LGFLLTFFFLVTGLNSQLEAAESLFCLSDKFNLSNFSAEIVRNCNENYVFGIISCFYLLLVADALALIISLQATLSNFLSKQMAFGCPHLYSTIN